MNQKPDGLNSIVDAFNAITGWNFTMDEALASRPTQHDSPEPLRHPARLDRRLRLARRRPKIFEPIPDGKYKGFTIAKWLPDLIYEYYRLSGRHERTGRPFKRHAGSTWLGGIHMQFDKLLGQG